MIRLIDGVDAATVGLGLGLMIAGVHGGPVDYFWWGLGAMALGFLVVLSRREK